MKYSQIYHKIGWGFLTCGCLFTLFVWILAYLNVMFSEINPFRGVICDGTFQLLNPLRRIDAGQVGGVDFQYFHGLGIPYIHYPLYKLFGSGLHASELSRYLVGLFMFVSGYCVIFYVISKRIIPTIILTVLAILLGEETWSSILAQPGNSLIGVRSFIPLVILALLFSGMQCYIQSALLGSLLGGGFLLSVEHGIAAFLAVIVSSSVLFCALKFPRSALFHIPIVIGTAIAVAGGGLLAIGGWTGVVQSLQYNFLIVPGDQFWYFGAPPNPFLKMWTEIPHQYQLIQLLGMCVLFLIPSLVGIIRSGGQSRLALGLFWANTYAIFTCISLLGYIDHSYLAAISRVVLISILVTGWHFYPEIRQRFAVPFSVLLMILLIFKLVCGTTRIGPSRATDLPALWESVQLHFRMQYIPNLRLLALHHQKQLDEFTQAIQNDTTDEQSQPVIWSTYSGLLESRLNVFHPVTDYLIHVLGPTARQEYVSKFEQVQPEYVTTVRNSYYGHEEWLRHGSWEFYERVLRNYSAYRIGEHQILWKRTSLPWNLPDEYTNIVSPEYDGNRDFAIPIPSNLPADAICVVNVEYDAYCDLQRIPVIGKLPRYLVIPTDCRSHLPISLPPYRHEWTFHLIPEPGKIPKLHAEVQSLVGGELKIKRVRVRILRLGSNAKAFHS